MDDLMDDRLADDELADDELADEGASQTVLDGVREVLVRTLGIEEQAAGIDAGTRLLGELPELDSLGVVELATALEVRFGIVVDDEDFVGEHFETVGALAAFVTARLG